MSWSHLHLALNHLPVLGAPFLLLLLGWGLLHRSRDLVRTALWWFIGFAVLAIMLKFTGDFARDEAAERLKPVAPLVTDHEQAADQATTGVFLLGLAATTAEILGRKGRAIPKWSLVVVFVLGLATSILMARTANLGGRINHPDLRPAGAPEVGR